MAGGLQTYYHELLAGEISSLTRYCSQLIQWQSLPHDDGEVFQAIDCPDKQLLEDENKLPDLSASRDRVAYLLNGNVNHSHDIQGLLLALHPRLNRHCRVVLVAHNPYLNWLWRLLTILGIRRGEQPQTFLRRVELDALTALSGFELVRLRPVGYLPRLLGLGSLLNRWLSLVPLVRWLGLGNVIILRPIIPEREPPSLSILIPARNEKGNIENALKRLPDFGGAELEIIFVEGHSQDDTWQEIERVKEAWSDRYRILAFQQTGEGKSDAVRLGFSKATCDLLTILDADLTMPPELLDRFYDAYCQGLGDFINGNRLLYPMEGEAMRFLNHLGNLFFARALSWTLDQRLGDSLCGTKLLTATDYQRMIDWRCDFGDFDPFGDFELLFPAAVLGLGVQDLPIRYRARTYGSTQIRRFRHGILLFKMTGIGLLKIKLGRWRRRADG